MFFMRQKIDVIMLDCENKVCYKKAGLKPWHIILPQKKAVDTLELPLYYSSFFEIGDSIILN